MQLYTVPSSALLLQTTFNICCRIVYLHVLLNFDCISTSVGRKNPKVNLTLRRQMDRPRPCCLYQPRQVPRHFPKMALLPCSLMGISVITAYYTYFLTAPTCVTNAKVILQQNCRLSGTGSSHTLQVFFGAFGRQFIQTRFQWSLLISHFGSLLPPSASLSHCWVYSMLIGLMCPYGQRQVARSVYILWTLWPQLQTDHRGLHADFRVDCLCWISLVHTVGGHVLQAYSTVFVLYVASDKSLS